MDKSALKKELAQDIADTIHAERRRIWDARADKPMAPSNPELEAVDRAVDATLATLQRLFEKLAPPRPVLRPIDEKPAIECEIFVRGQQVSVEGSPLQCLPKEETAFITLSWTPTNSPKPRGNITRKTHGILFDEFSIVQAYFDAWQSTKREQEAYHASQAELAKPAHADPAPQPGAAPKIATADSTPKPTQAEQKPASRRAAA